MPDPDALSGPDASLAAVGLTDVATGHRRRLWAIPEHGPRSAASVAQTSLSADEQPSGRREDLVDSSRRGDSRPMFGRLEHPLAIRTPQPELSRDVQAEIRDRQRIVAAGLREGGTKELDVVQPVGDQLLVVPLEVTHAAACRQPLQYNA